MKPTVLGIVIVLSLVAAGAIFYGGSAFAPSSQQSLVQTYSNEAYGLSFSYPVGYVLSERSGNNNAYHITLIREEDAVPVVGGGEGPRAITVDVYTLPEDQTVIDWMNTSPFSNFGLGQEKKYEERVVAGTTAVRYSWSGLYEGITTVLTQGNRVYTISVSFNSPADDIRFDYESVLDSLRVR